MVIFFPGAHWKHIYITYKRGCARHTRAFLNISFRDVAVEAFAIFTLLSSCFVWAAWDAGVVAFICVSFRCILSDHLSKKSCGRSLVLSGVVFCHEAS